MRLVLLSLLVAGVAHASPPPPLEILQFPADGTTMFGTQKSRPAWDVDAAELWELSRANGTWTKAAHVAHWESVPLSLHRTAKAATSPPR